MTTWKCSLTMTAAIEVPSLQLWKHPPKRPRKKPRCIQLSSHQSYYHSTTLVSSHSRSSPSGCLIPLRHFNKIPPATKTITVTTEANCSLTVNSHSQSNQCQVKKSTFDTNLLNHNQNYHLLC